jgi:hypothetical protein
VRELLTPQVLLLAGVASVVTAVLGAVGTAWAVVRLPADYVKDRQRHTDPAVGFGVRLGKNLLGFCALLFGAVMAVPGVPGPGLVTILLGVMLLDFPGKYAAERWLVRLPIVHRAIDELRARFGREPLQLP